MAHSLVLLLAASISVVAQLPAVTSGSDARAPALAPALSPTLVAAQTPAAATPFDLRAVDTSIVQVIVRVNNDDGTITVKQGTGVVLPNGYVFTAGHMFAQYSTVEVVFGGRSLRGLGGPGSGGVRLQHSSHWHPDKQKIWFFSGTDVVLLGGVDTPSWVAPARLSRHKAKEADLMTAVGLKDPQTPRIRTGGVTIETGKANLPATFEVDYSSTHGDSGGPVFHRDGSLAGIHVATITRTITYADGRQEQRVSSLAYDLSELQLPR